MHSINVNFSFNDYPCQVTFHHLIYKLQHYLLCGPFKVCVINNTHIYKTSVMAIVQARIYNYQPSLPQDISVPLRS